MLFASLRDLALCLFSCSDQLGSGQAWAGKEALHFCELQRAVRKQLVTLGDCGRNSSDNSVRDEKLPGEKHVFISKSMLVSAEVMYPVLLEQQKGYRLCVLVVGRQGCLHFASVTAELHISSLCLCLCDVTPLADSLQKYVLLPCSETSCKRIGLTSVKFFNF